MTTPAYRKVDFDEAIGFLRQKVNLPTKRWDDLWQGHHARAFVVAGATKDQLLADLRGAIDNAISQGTTLKTFRKDFDAIVQKHGWAYKGGKAWRTRVMFETNLRTAYAAGRYKQLQKVKATRPYLVYRHGDSANPRPEHLGWEGTVLHQDHPWWNSHYPPNGWGCSCKVFSASERDLKRMGKSGPDAPPDNGTYEWQDKAGKSHTIPTGIDPGWAYNVGQADSGTRLPAQVMAEFKASGQGRWQRLTPGDWQSQGRPPVPMDASTTKVGRRLKTPAAAETLLGKLLGGPQKVFQFKAGDFTYSTTVDAKALADHVNLARSPWLPFLAEALSDPYEVWMAFEREVPTGRIRLVQRIVKGFDVGKGKTMLVVANVHKGQLAAWTVIPTDRTGYINKQRVGKLVWKRGQKK